MNGHRDCGGDAMTSEDAGQVPRPVPAGGEPGPRPASPRAPGVQPASGARGTSTSAQPLTRGSSSADSGPGGGSVRQLPAGTAPEDPGGDARPLAASPPGTPLRGEDFRAAVRAAESALHAQQRRQRAQPPRKGTTRYTPGGNRRLPPQGGGSG